MKGPSRSAGKPAAKSNSAAMNELESVSRLPRVELVEHWNLAFGQPPPKGASTTLLRRAVAYRIQEVQLGGLRKRELKALLQFADPVAAVATANYNKRTPGKQGPAAEGDDASHRGSLSETGPQIVLAASSQHRVAAKSSEPHGSRLPPVPRPGTRLVRSWQGKTHVVEVVEDGFAWNRKTYRSLSAVASAITGARWSGRRFFRL